MQNRYVADIGDYVKFAILRALAPGRKLGVVWWLFPNEQHNADGGHRQYLERPNEWEDFDSDLFKALQNIKEQRDVRALENAAILPGAVFISDPVPCGVRERGTWFEGIKTGITDCTLVFLDPDNGIAPEGLKLSQRRAGKSVTIEEIKALQKSGRAVVVYHHQTRLKGGHLSEIEMVAKRLRARGLHVSGALRANPWSPRAFFILNGDKTLHDRAQGLAHMWKDRITWHPEAELLKS
jgi:hypothetical protein